MIKPQYFRRKELKPIMKIERTLGVLKKVEISDLKLTDGTKIIFMNA
jgi:hypothetical protein